LLLFDLDETLIHVKRDTGQLKNDAFEPEVSLPVFDPESGLYIKTLFSVRPYARKCLEFANKYFEVGIFTAGNSWFADPIISYLDPKGTLIQHRYFRQHTSLLGSGDTEEGSFLAKDLTILKGEVSLDDILIIDNNIYSFAFNLENGIPVNDYLGNKNDKALLQVMNYLNYIKDFENLRVENEKVYELKMIFDT